MTAIEKAFWVVVLILAVGVLALLVGALAVIRRTNPWHE